MSRTTFYQRNYIGWPPVHVRQHADPNSAHWQEKAEQANNALNILFTDEQKEIFATAWDRMGSHRTWKEAADQWHKAAEMLQAGAGLTEILEELDLLEGQSCTETIK